MMNRFHVSCFVEDSPCPEYFSIVFGALFSVCGISRVPYFKYRLNVNGAHFTLPVYGLPLL